MKKYVKEYKGYKVPEGATHFTEKTDKDHAAFWNNDILWVLIDDIIEEYPAHGVPKSAIELPEAKQKRGGKEWNGEGLPPAGTECEISCDGRTWCKRLINYIGKNIVVCTNELGVEIAYPIKDIVRFQPVTTQEQKDREAFVDKALEEIETKAGLVAPDKAIFEIMFDAGARFK